MAVLGLHCCAGFFSTCREQRPFSSGRCVGFSLQWLVLLWGTISRHESFSNCGSRALEHKLSIWGTMGSIALQHVGPSWTRDRTHVSCVGR